MISPTLACIDYLHIEREIRKMDRIGADSYHIDIMDGHYVPNLCLNFDIIRKIRSISATPMDVHLMVNNPYKYIDAMSELKIEYACTHMDAVDRPEEFLQRLHQKGIRAGLAISPHVPVESVAPYFEQVDYFLLMFVNPGFSGQEFQPEVLSKMKRLAELRSENGYRWKLFADGGIGWNNAADVVRVGGDLIVAGLFTVFEKGLESDRALLKLKTLIKLEEDALEDDCTWM